MNKIIFFNDYDSKLSYNEIKLKKIVNKVLYDKNHCNAEISIILSTKQKLNQLKKDFFNVNQYTDVITFNLEDSGKPIEGEIYISIDDILSNSKIYNQTFNEEFKRIFVHGVLHLVGYEDKTEIEKKTMNDLENKYILNNKDELISHNV